MSDETVQFVTREDFQRSIAAVMEELKASREMASEWQAKAERLQEQEQLAFLNRREEDKATRAREMVEHQRMSIMATLGADSFTSQLPRNAEDWARGLRVFADAIMEAAR